MAYYNGYYSRRSRRSRSQTPEQKQYAHLHRFFPKSYLKLMKTFLNPKIHDKEKYFHALQAEHAQVMREKSQGEAEQTQVVRKKSEAYFCPICNHKHKPGSNPFKKHFEQANQKISFLPIRCDPIETIYSFQIFMPEPLDNTDLEQIPMGAPLSLRFETGQWSKEEKINYALNDHLDKIVWSDYKKVNTYLGRRMVKSAPMTPELWKLWKSNKVALKTAGYSISNYYGWKISHWKESPKPKLKVKTFLAEKKKQTGLLKIIKKNSETEETEEKEPEATPDPSLKALSKPTTEPTTTKRVQKIPPDTFQERLKRNQKISVSEIQDLKKLCWSEYSSYEPPSGGHFLRKSTPIPPILSPFLRKNKTLLTKFGYSTSTSTLKLVLYHQKIVESIQEIFPELADVLQTLPWSQPKEVVSTSGKALHVRSTPVDEAFWNMWREKKTLLKRLGYSISQYEKTWKLSQWITPQKSINESIKQSSVGIYYNKIKLGYVSPTYEDEIKQLVNGTNGKVLCFLQSKPNMMCQLRLVDYGSLFENLTGLIQIKQLADVDIFKPIRSMGSEAIIIEGIFLYLDQNLKQLEHIQNILHECFKYGKNPPMELAIRYMHGEHLTQKEVAELVSNATYKERQLLESVLPPENEVLKKLIYLYQVKTDKGFEILL